MWLCFFRLNLGSYTEIEASNWVCSRIVKYNLDCIHWISGLSPGVSAGDLKPSYIRMGLWKTLLELIQGKQWTLFFCLALLHHNVTVASEFHVKSVLFYCCKYLSAHETYFTCFVFLLHLHEMSNYNFVILNCSFTGKLNAILSLVVKFQDCI